MADAPEGAYRLQVEPTVLTQASQQLHTIADELDTAHHRLVGEHRGGRSRRGRGRDADHYGEGQGRACRGLRPRIASPAGRTIPI